MSRARLITLPDGQEKWFDADRNHKRATDEQLELLAAVEDVDLDDLLDTILTQGEVLERLRMALGQGVIPSEVLERRRKWKNQRQLQPKCRKCGKQGNSTKHHFVNKWILKELSDYASRWSDRSKNCINLCTHCHRHLHFREEEDKSVAVLLTDEERQFAEDALNNLAEERPKLLLLIAKGDKIVYETRLVRDWINGEFAV